MCGGAETGSGRADSSPSNGTDGGCSRPIVIEEHDRPSAREWTNGWSDASRPAYSQEQQQHAEYAHAPSNSSYGRPPPSEQHVSHLPPAPTPARPHTARQYHHTQETMADKLNKSTPAMAEVHPSQQSMMVAHSAGHPGPPPPYFAPPPSRHEKSEKAKMMNEEPCYLFDRKLVAEREKCRRAVYAFKNTCNNNLVISDREYHLVCELESDAARWWTYRAPGQVGFRRYTVHVPLWLQSPHWQSCRDLLFCCCFSVAIQV
ncbi:hypothetical protein K505DRAFT_340588 [Melanomma pulvis-pyrius CBS 109.77]|uniref:Uncharacterized protein n=1 Tax=Melanomma pulvis-pyrius CBS 109.77 TaxID=1314802 RepID=A0A6A6X290_9PLEO|nr:hypothetical protein K505DRAFT_340588 [Melanomma pulvis-pyrius CBS 109.77]